MSKIKVNSIEAATGSTVTLPSGQTLDLSSGTVTLPNSSVNLTTKVTGTLPVANGGTGLTTLGSASQVLRVNSGATALEFGTLASGILQVKQTYKTDTFNTSASTLTDVTGLSVTITPTLSSSKILVFVHVAGAARASAGGNVRLLRGSTQIGLADAASNRSLSSLSGNLWITSDHDAARSMCTMFLDAPATTSSTTYKIQVKNGTGAATNINRTNNDTDSEDTPGRMTSSITVFEIASSILT